MNSAGVQPKSTAQKWQFSVQIQGFDAAYFTKSSLPELSFEEVKFAPAGSMFDQKTAGRAEFADITLEKGVPQENPETNMLDWARQCITVAAATGGVPSDYMRDVDLVQYDRKGNEFRRFRLFGAWPKSIKHGDLEGSSSDNVIETLDLTFQYFDTV